MKNSQFLPTQPNNVIEPQSIFNKNPSPSEKDIDFSNLYLNCSGKNLSTQMCINKKCQQKLPLVCSNMQCCCQSSHEQCLKANLRFITKKLSQKISQSQSIKLQIEEIFDNIIDSLSDLRNRILNQIDFKFKYANLHNLQYTLLKGLEKNEFPQSLIGQSEKIWKLLTQKIQQKPNYFEILQQKINGLKAVIDQKQTKIMAFINNQAIKLQQENTFFLNSSLGLSQIENLQKIQGFFNKRLKSAILLFKASDFKFQISKFYEICGQEKNIMIVCQTNQKKLIGGYTPLYFKGGEMDNYVQDPSQQTFIFSLTNNDKFRMKTSGNAIYRVSGQERICFGGCQFQICNQADRVKKCRSYSLNYYFQNDKYESNKTESFERFNGNQDEYFTVKEWEVWKIYFDDEQILQDKLDR